MNNYIKKILPLLFFICSLNATNLDGSWDALKNEAKTIGKPEWHPVLLYVADLHQKSTHPPTPPLSREWEEIGLGYSFGAAFGHWDIVHQIEDVLKSFPKHALNQLLNNLENQTQTGMIPGSIWMPSTHHRQRTEARWDTKDQGHPPVWIAAAQDYMDITKDESVLPKFFDALVKQISWFENFRKATDTGEGFYYTDITLRKWESGVDKGVRFDDAPKGKFACIDATSHVYWMYDHAAKWAKKLGKDSSHFEKRSSELKNFIQTKLYDKKDGTFYDIWAIENPQLRHKIFESMWPIVTGAASPEQAKRYINEYIMNPDVFLTPHPISTVGVKDEKFALHLWRGPAWNSMTLWAMRGCRNYGRYDAVVILGERAMDSTAKQFKETGVIWEFYHPFQGSPLELRRKGKSKACQDYLGHNPLFEITRMYDAAKSK